MCTKDQFKEEGKRAFHPDKDPFVLNPYPHASKVRAYDIWLEGWQETAIEQEQKKHLLSYHHILTKGKKMFIDNSNFLNHVQCSVFEEYLTQTFKETSCWQLARKIEDFRFDSHVCQDCIVYKYAKPNDEFNKQQIEIILHKRKILKEVSNIQ